MPLLDKVHKIESIILICRKLTKRRTEEKFILRS